MNKEYRFPYSSIFIDYCKESINTILNAKVFIGERIFILCTMLNKKNLLLIGYAIKFLFLELLDVLCSYVKLTRCRFYE